MSKHRPKRGRAPNRKLVAAAFAVVSAALLPAAGAGGSSLTFEERASFERCHDQVNFLNVPVERARKWVPDDKAYKLMTETFTETGATAILAISILRCDKVAVSGTTLPGTVSMAFAAFSLINMGAEEHPQADGGTDDPTDDAVGAPGDRPGQDYYMLFFSTDSKPLADWLRAGTDLAAYYVPGINYDYPIPTPYGNPPTAAPFSFEAPAPADWAFSVNGSASVQHVGGTEVFIDDNFWQDTKTPGGRTWRVKLAAPYHADWAARADVTVEAQPGSKLHQILAPDGWPADKPYPAKDPFAVSVLIDDWDAEKTRTIIRP